MDQATFNLFLADAILFLHVFIVAFNVIGLVLISVGGMLRWSWIRDPWFRVVHLATIVIVVIQSWLGVICPLTTLEMTLRSRAGDAVYAGSFISHWLSSIFYLQAPAWAFTIAYAAFGIVVVAGWFLVRPRPFRNERQKRHSRNS